MSGTEWLEMMEAFLRDVWILKGAIALLVLWNVIVSLVLWNRRK